MHKGQMIHNQYNYIVIHLLKFLYCLLQVVPCLRILPQLEFGLRQLVVEAVRCGRRRPCSRVKGTLKVNASIMEPSGSSKIDLRTRNFAFKVEDRNVLILPLH